MIREGRDLLAAGRNIAERSDVCVVGTGCGGASLAARLAEAGLDVVLFEQGGYYTATDFDQRELHALAKIDGGRGMQVSKESGVSLTYGNNVGGASVHYWADSYRTPTDRLELWEKEFGLQGHGAAVLAPYFEQIERDHNVHPADDDHVNRMNALLKAGADRLGWVAERVPQARRGCVKSGHCMQGCAYDAKQSQLVTYVPRAVSRGARIYADTKATRFEWRGPEATALVGAVLDRATGRPVGIDVRVEARAFVVAAGGYATPEVLLRAGFGPRLPALGRHFFCNPCPMTHALFDEDVIQWRNIPAAWGISGFRLARHDGGGHVFGRTPSGRYVEGGYLLMPNQLHPATLAATLPGIGPEHARLMKNLRRLGGAISWIDDAEEGRIFLEGDRRRVDVPLHGGNAERIRDAWRKQAQVLLAAGATEVLFGDAADTRVQHADEIDAAVARIDLRPGRNVFAAPHPGGGARMGKDPKDSVVGFDHRVHGTDNLYVADPSVFPTPPSVDPSLSIMAFSFVAAEHVRAALG